MIKAIKYLIVGSIIGIIASFISIGANKMYKSLLFKYVSKSTYRVYGYAKDQENPFVFGSGFYVKGKSGKVYFVTARHVCNELKQGKIISADNDLSLTPVNSLSSLIKPVDTLKIVKISENADICILSGQKDMPTLSFNTNKIAKDQELYLTGGFSVFPTNLLSGNAISFLQQVEIPIMVATSEECRYKNQKLSYLLNGKPVDKLPDVIRKFDDMYGIPFGPILIPVDVRLICKERTDMVLVNIPIRGGNSGGAVVDSFGRVVGIATVGVEKEIGGMIPASEIVKELEDL